MRSRLVTGALAGPTLAVLAYVSIACAPAAASTHHDLTVYGAASLSGVLDEVEAAYEAATPDTRITLSTDSSSALATQIVLGAPADVFLSADTTNPQRLAEGGLVDREPITFAANELVVIVPAGNPADIDTPADLGRPGVKVIAAGGEVPITRYATVLVDNLAAEPGYPQDFGAAYDANVVSREDNVKAVVAKIELGEGDAGIVYLTDATASNRIETVEVPDTANVAANYAGVVINASPDLTAAHRFMDWFVGPDGQAILARFGFQPPS